MSAQRFLHADGPTALPSLTIPTTRPMLPIRQHLKTSPLKPGPKAVLMEVCELHENGKKGACFISNTELAKSLGISLKTATRTIQALVAGGLLTSRVVEAEANRRYLAPTAPVRACYMGGDIAAQLLAASNLTIVRSSDDEELTIVKSESDYSQNGTVTIVKNDPDYSQNASRVYGDNQDKHSTSKEEVEALRATLAAAEKKIEALQNENATLTASLETVTHQRDQLRHTLKAQPTTGNTRGAGPAAPAADPHKVPFAQSRHATPEGFAKLATALNYGAASYAHYRPQMLVKAGDELRDEKGWQNFVQRYLTNDANSETGLVTKVAKTQPSAAGRDYAAQQQQQLQKDYL
ncbi:helix-turn-helix domain-containing protein [Hymenobacter metallicola]|uniref:Uncharacterized protein n=1 Tax=Hymenobacter metallicola TaxID=2563114 RepID=A0A4Z0Q256_9BACT|nr:helix-turn-helix domain-containing protein [Hymenobacter metallicola]TGE22802.1 hypothetical protein E5K02_20775 [Hymenobacter metallicola]